MHSGLKMVSLGIVAEHKKPSSKSTMIHPAEVLTEIDGELRGIPIILYSAGVDGENREYQLNIEANVALDCEWLQLGEHRMSAPDIRRGEQVIIWEIEGSTDEKYYWSSLGRDSRLRRLESVLWAFSNVSDPEEDVEELNYDNSYTVEISTHTKQITIRTNKYDGEPFEYVIQLNTKDGNFTIKDDVGNYIQLDSAETMIDFTNKDKTHFRMDKKNIYAYAPDSIMMEAVNSMKFKCKDYILEASNSITTKTKTMEHTASTVLYKAGNMKIDSPMTECTGILKCKALDAGGGGLTADSSGIKSKAAAFDAAPTAPGGKWHFP
jgi:phage baseplate assembly protein gpV